MSEVPSGAGPGSATVARRVRATILFVDIMGFSAVSEKLGAERAYLFFTRLLKLLDGVARRHGGSVDKYQGDSLMVVFGHPVPLRDPAAAGLDAAMEMRRSVHDANREFDADVPIDVRIGVNTGPVVFGDVHGPIVREFHVLGDAVNVAARLKAKAPAGSIYVGPETRDETASRIRYRTLEPLSLKGKSRPVPAFEVLAALDDESQTGLGETFGSEGPILGREQEQDLLRKRLAQLAESGKGGVIAIEGDEGLGKSRLVSELRKLADEGEIRVWEARATSARREVALHLFSRLPAGGETRGPEEIERALSAEAGDEPLLVLIEDLQWSDPASLELLGILLGRTTGRPLLWVLTYRPEREGGTDSVRSLLHERIGADVETVEYIELLPLEPGPARAVVDALLDDDDDDEGVSDTVRDLIVSRAQGVPGRLVMGVYLAPTLRSESDLAQRTRERGTEAERRRATILFADITGFTSMTEQLGAERAYPIVAGALQLLDGIARKHGGTVDKYLGDCVMALYGVPEAIEDAPRAATNAAIEMRRAIAEYNQEQGLPQELDVHTGIHTGLGIAGDISGPLVREFAVMGDPVDIAAQLTDHASAGEIYVGGSTRDLTEGVFEFAEVAPVEAAGGGAPVRAFEVLSRTTQLHRARLGTGRQVRSPLVGRDAEMATLRAGVAGILEGRGGVVSIIADAGLGKSRLIAELMGSDQAAEVTWLEGRSLSTGRNLSFHPFADLARSFAGVADEDDEAQAREKLQSAVGGLLPDEADQVVPFLAQLLGMPLEPGERELLERIPRDNMERMLRSGVTQLLRRSAELTPLVIVMDDLHWADQSSIELLESLLRLATEHRILFLHVFRPAYAETSERVLALAREQYTDLHEEVLLGPLGPKAARELVRNLFKEGDIPHAIRTMIEEKAQGNPFYIEEVVRALLDEGAVVLQDDRFQATDKIHSVVIPDTVHEVIAARVDRLELARRQLLQTAAVVGGSFHLDVLLQVARGPEGAPGELDADLEALIDAEFIVPYDRSQGIEYAFKHPLIQEVTYDALLQTRREQLHLSVAEAILASLPEDLVGYNGMLAYHFSKGRDSERAEDYLFRAGDEAARFAASSEALDLFRQASDLYVELHGDGGDPRKRALLEKNMGFALFHRGQLIESVDRFGKALEHLGIRIPRGDLALQLRFARDMLAILVHLYLPGIDRKRPAATDVQREAIEIMFNRGLAQTTTAPTRFVFDTMSSLRWLMRLDPSTIPESGGKYAGSVGIWSYGGVSFSLGRKFLDLAKPLIPQETAPDYLYYRLLNFIHHMLQGDWSEEHEIGEAVLERNLREGRLWDVTTYLGLEAEKRIRRGQFDRVRERLDQIDDIWERFEYDLAKTNHYWLPTCLRLEQRRLDEAVSAAEIYYDENPEDLLHLLALGSKAAAQSLAGEDDEAVEEALDKAEAIVARSGPVFPFHLSCYRSARFAADVRRLEVAGPPHGSSRRDLERRARRSGRAAISTSKKVAYRQPEIFRMAGRLAWLRGKPNEALGWWTRSLEVADRLGLQPERARTQQEAGQRLQDAPNGVGSFLGLEAKGHLEEAGAAFDRLGLAWDLERLEAGSVT